MTFENFLKGAGKVASGLLIDHAAEAARELTGAGGGQQPLEMLAAGLPGWSPLRRGLGQALVPAGGRGWRVLVQAAGPAVAVSHATEMAYGRRQMPVALLAVLLRRNHSAGYAAWETQPEGGRERVVCRAMVPAAGLTAASLSDVAHGVAHEVAELLAEMSN